MHIERNLYRLLIDSLQYSLDNGEQGWLPGCHLKYCQECRQCGFHQYKIRPVVEAGKVTGLYLDYAGAKQETISG